MSKRFVSLAILTALLSFTLNCSSQNAKKAKSTASKNSATQPAAQAALKGLADDIVIEVNGIKVKRRQFEKKYNAQFHGFLRQYGLSDTAELPPQLKNIKGKIRERLASVYVNRLVLLSEAQKEKTTVADSEIKSTWQEYKKTYPNEEAFQKDLKKQNMTQKAVLTQIREELTVNKFLDKKLKDAKASDKEAKKFFEKNKDKMNTPELVEARHILIQTADTALTTIKKIRKEILNGKDFSAMARKYSQGPSGAKGGALGVFRRGQMVPAFDKAAFQLPIGKVSKPVKTRFGYHLIIVDQHSKEKAANFKDSKKRIIATLSRKKQNEKMKELMTELVKKSQIVNRIKK